RTGRGESHVERVEEDGLRGGGGEPRLQVRQGRAARGRDRGREGIPEAAGPVAMSLPPPPPPDDGGFTAPPLWQRGHPVELRRLTLSDIMDTAYNLYRMYWRSLVGVVALLVVPLNFLQS